MAVRIQRFVCLLGSVRLQCSQPEVAKKNSNCIRLVKDILFLAFTNRCSFLLKSRIVFLFHINSPECFLDVILIEHSASWIFADAELEHLFEGCHFTDFYTASHIARCVFVQTMHNGELIRLEHRSQLVNNR